MTRYSKRTGKRLAKSFGPYILRTALAIKYATSYSKKKRVSAQERHLIYSYLIPEFGKAMAEALDTRYQLKRLLETESVRWGFIELIVVIELINVCRGKNPSGDFIKAFKDCVPEKKMSNRSFFYHLATLLYLDGKNKLFKAVIEHPLFPDISARDIIKLAAHAISNERYAQKTRLDSDPVKIKGAVKNAKIIPNEREAFSKDGDDYIIEEAFEPTENFYKQLFKSQLTKKLRSDLVRYIQKSNRSRRQRNTMAYIDYILSTKEKKLNIKRAASILKLSRKTLHQIKKSLQGNIGFKRLLNTFLINNR